VASLSTKRSGRCGGQLEVNRVLLKRAALRR
jgi:hypothetical protein